MAKFGSIVRSFRLKGAASSAGWLQLIRLLACISRRLDMLLVGVPMFRELSEVGRGKERVSSKQLSAASLTLSRRSFTVKVERQFAVAGSTREIICDLPLLLCDLIRRYPLVEDA